MQKTDLTTRTVAGFIDLLIVIGLARLPDVIGYLAAIGYILVRDGLFSQQSAGKRIFGLRVVSADDPGRALSFRESIIRNMPLAIAFLLFRVPYAGWILCPLVLVVEALAALGDERGMRIGDLLARTCAVQAGPSVSPAPVTAAAPDAAVAAVPATTPQTDEVQASGNDNPPNIS
jgi:uncharacterized RDD family membrane protein YckC